MPTGPDADELARRVRRFVADGTGLDSKWVIPGNDDGTRPEVPYASVLLVEDTGEGHADMTYRPDDTIMYGHTQRIAWYSVQFYRKGASVLALRLASWVETQTGLDRAESYGFSVADEGLPLTPRRLDDEVDSQWEERVVVDLRVAYAYAFEERMESVADDGASVVVEMDGGHREEI